jgi:hypothetical protein
MRWTTGWNGELLIIGAGPNSVVGAISVYEKQFSVH